MRAFAPQEAGWIFHSHLGAQVGIHPFHRPVFPNRRTLSDQVVNVGGPVLNRGVAHPCIFLDNDFNHAAMERFGRVQRRSTTFHVMNLCAFVCDDQRALKLPHAGIVQAEVCLQRQIHLYAFGNVNERAARPNRAVECGEFVILDRYHGREVFAEEIRVLLESVLDAEENHALFLKRFLDIVVNHFRVILRAHTGEVFLLSLGDTQLIEGGLDRVRHIFPGFLVNLRRTDIIIDIIQVQTAQIRTPGGHRTLKVVIVCF